MVCLGSDSRLFWVCCDWTRPICMRVAVLRCWIAVMGVTETKLSWNASSQRQFRPPKKTSPFLDMIFPLFWMLMTMTTGPRVWVEAATSWWRNFPATPRRSNWGAGGGRMLTWHHWFPVDFIADFPVVSLRACKRPSPSYLAAPSSRSASEAE